MTHGAKIILVEESELQAGLTAPETSFPFVHRAESVQAAALQALTSHHPLGETIVRGKRLLRFIGGCLQPWVSMVSSARLISTGVSNWLLKKLRTWRRRDKSFSCWKRHLRFGERNLLSSCNKTEEILCFSTDITKASQPSNSHEVLQTPEVGGNTLQDFERHSARKRHRLYKSCNQGKENPRTNTCILSELLRLTNHLCCLFSMWALCYSRLSECEMVVQNLSWGFQWDQKEHEKVKAVKATSSPTSVSCCDRDSPGSYGFNNTDCSCLCQLCSSKSIIQLGKLPGITPIKLWT